MRRRRRSAGCRAGIAGEVLVVDNGSTDGSRRARRRRRRPVVHERRARLRPGLPARLRRGPRRLSRHGRRRRHLRLQRPRRLIAPLAQGADIVLGNRFAGGIAAGRDALGAPLHRHARSSPSSALVHRPQVGDSQCGLRAFTREAFQRLDLRRDGMELASEMIVKAARRGLDRRRARAVRAAWARASSTPSVTAGATCASCSSPPRLPVHAARPAALGAALGDRVASFLAPTASSLGSLTLAAGLRGHDPPGDRRERGPLRRGRQAVRWSARAHGRGPMVAAYRRWFTAGGPALGLAMLGSSGWSSPSSCSSSGGRRARVAVQGLSLAALAQTLIIVGAELRAWPASSASSRWIRRTSSPELPDLPTPDRLRLRRPRSRRVRAAPSAASTRWPTRLAADHDVHHVSWQWWDGASTARIDVRDGMTLHGVGRGPTLYGGDGKRTVSRGGCVQRPRCCRCWSGTAST